MGGCCVIGSKQNKVKVFLEHKTAEFVQNHINDINGAFSSNSETDEVTGQIIDFDHDRYSFQYSRFNSIKEFEFMEKCKTGDMVLFYYMGGEPICKRTSMRYPFDELGFVIKNDA